MRAKGPKFRKHLNEAQRIFVAGEYGSTSSLTGRRSTKSDLEKRDIMLKCKQFTEYSPLIYVQGRSK